MDELSTNAANNDGPRMGGPGVEGDGTNDSSRPGASRRPLFADARDDVERALLDALRSMSASGETAEAEYQRALRRVKEQSGDTVAEKVRGALDALPEQSYLDRWGLMQLLTDASVPATMDSFENVLSAPIPPERSAGSDHRYSTVGQEVVIRTTAVEGLRRLAASGQESATRLLLRHLRHEQRSIRVACVMALRELGGDAEAAMREALADEDRDLLEIRRLRVADVPQPTPPRSEGSTGRGGPVPPPVS